VSRHLHLQATRLTIILLAALISLTLPTSGWSFASNNVPLDSPIYSYLDKLTGFGLIDTEVAALRPFAKAEVVRLVLEAQGNLGALDGEERRFADQIIARLEDLLPREFALRRGDKAPWIGYNPGPAARLRYVYLDGVPRSFTRQVFDPGGQSVFGFIGGNLRHTPPAIIGKAGSEGTPLLENNEGINYGRGSNLDASVALEGYLGSSASLLIEPDLLVEPDDTELVLRKGYLKLGGGGLELEVGRDANWFGPGYRGALTLTNNARNFDLVKISSPEPLNFDWVKRHLGQLKYAFIVSRFGATGSGQSLREPYFLGGKISLKPNSWFEIGGNFVRQEGGPGLKGSTSIQDLVFGGGDTNKSNSIAGIDLRFTIPQLRNAQLYAEYVGEDSALFWPFVESYLAGFYLPRLSASGKDDFRFEYLWAHQLLYSDFKFPAGYTFHNMSPGHSQGGGTEDFFCRYTHWFSLRTTSALELFHTDRGKWGRVPGQAIERKNAVRGFFSTPLYGDLDLGLMYGWENIENFNLEQGTKQTNQLMKLDLNYRY
jgi:hypothetical protein